MANETILLRIVTPAGVALEERITEISLPGSDGEIGVLPRHTQYTGLLGIGVLSFKNEQNEVRRAVISGGFSQFSDGTLSVVADSIDTAEEIDREGYASKRSELTRVIESEDSRSNRWIDARQALSRIEAIDQLIAA